MRGATLVAALAVALTVAGCDDTDRPNTGEEIAPGEELEDGGVEVDVEPVVLEEQRWFREGGTVEYNGRTWILQGSPVYDPAVTYVGEYEGTPLYAEVGTSAPYDELFIPLEDDYWQLLIPTGDDFGADTASDVPRGSPGIEPVGDPRGDGGSGGGDGG